MARLTRAFRKATIEEFLKSIGRDTYMPEEFLEWIRKRPTHPAHAFFQWDDVAAAHEHRLDQARDFARGIRILYSEQVIHHAPVRVSMPQFISPLATRESGGGYIKLDPADPASMELLAEEASRALGAWIRRYEAAAMHRGISIAPVKKIAGQLAVPLRLLKTAAKPGGGKN